MQFALLESSSVDDDLASLKKELSGGTKVVFQYCLSFYLLRNSYLGCGDSIAPIVGHGNRVSNHLTYEVLEKQFN